MDGLSLDMDIVNNDSIATPIAPVWGLEAPIAFARSKIFLVDQSPNITEFERSDKLIQIAHELHGDFEKNKRKKSFHNTDHIKAVESAVDATLGKIDTDDPFGLNNALNSWNARRSPERQATQVQMAMAIKIAVATHDLGNIVDTLGFADNGFVPRFNKSYKSSGAEDRSKHVARTLIMGMGFSDKTLNKVLPLVEHLIGETTYDFTGANTGFAPFMRTVDQIGNALYNPTDFANNLLYEMVGENPEANFVPYDHFNFANDRFGYLIPNEGMRTRILELWNKKLPKLNDGLSREPIRISDYLALNFNSNGRSH